MTHDQPISTSSAASEDSLLPRSGPDSKPSDSAKRTSVAGPSSKSRGANQSTPTSAPATPSHIAESLFSQEDHPASRRVEPGSKEAREMTAGSGRKLCACLRKQSRIASFSRTLLESSTWESTEYFLRWEGSATKCNRSIFRLVPWTRPNSDTESGLWASPQASVPNATESVESWRARAAKLKEKHGNGNGAGMPLGIQAKTVTWPTPNAKDESQHRNKTANRSNPESKHHDGTTLTDAVSAWPTPDASEAGKTSRGGDRIDEPLIGGIVRTTWKTPSANEDAAGKWKPDGELAMQEMFAHQVKGAWPTPRQADFDKGVRSPEGYEKEKERMGDGCDLPTELSVIGKTPYGCLAQTESFVVRLMTLSAWLMGYTGAYLRRWETASSRRKRSKSSESSEP